MDIQRISGGICSPEGFKAGGIACGIKKNGTDDLALIISEADCAAAACYTQNKVKGAPLEITRRHIENGSARGILVNSGNANTCNADGLTVAETCCELAAAATGLRADDFVVASTGVIGQALPIAPFERGLPTLAARLSRDGGTEAAKAIMTTDTIVKEFAVEFILDGKTCRMGAIGKGSGMINPNMATMLIFVTTDAAISADLLHDTLKDEVSASFNQICVDGDTSTNDMVAILANGMAGNSEITASGAELDIFSAALSDVCSRMSRSIAGDGEGATKLLECRVHNARNVKIARAIAKSIISSDLFKSAMFGNDANWGRALCAIGYTPGDFSADNVSLTLKSCAGEVLVCVGSAHREFSEELAAKVLSEREIQVLVDMNDGDSQGVAWGCDLTYDYVKINGDYRT